MPHHRNRPAFSPPRVTWNNGYWKLFDPIRFEDVGIFRLRKDAVAALASPSKVTR